MIMEVFPLRIGKLKKETFWAALSKGGTLVFFLLINAALARILGRDKFGAWSYFYATFTIIYLASRLGIGDSARVFTARALGGNTTPPIVAGLALQALSSSLFSLGLLLAAFPLAALMDRPDFTLLFRFGALFLFTQGAADFFKLIFEGLHRLRFTFMASTVDYALRLALIVGLVWFFPEPWAVLAAFITATLLCAAVSLFLLRRHFILPMGGWSARGLPLFPMMAYAVPMFLLNLGFAVSVELDTVMLGWLTTDMEVGIYAPAKEISARMMHGGVLLAMSTLQVFAHAKPEELPGLRPLLNKLLGVAVVFYTACCAAILFFAGWVMPFLFGAEYADAAIPMRLLTPFIFYLSVSRVFTGILDYRGRAWMRAAYLALSVLLNFALNLVLIPRFGAAGAATATSLAYLPYAVLSWWDMRRLLKPAVPAPPPEVETAGENE